MKMFKIWIRPAAGAAIAICFAALIASCGTVEKVGAWWQGGAAEAPRLAPGVGEYLCEGGKSFQARFDPATHSAWVRFPDREFRLDAAPGTAEGRYTNGRTTLSSKAEELSLTEGATVIYAGCKRATAG